MIQHTDRLCTAEKARHDAVLERLGLSRQDVPQPSPQSPAARRRRRLSPLRDVPRHLKRNQRSLDEEEDDSFWDKFLLGSGMAAQVHKEFRMADTSPTASIGSLDSLSSVDTHTPSELRAISLIGSPVESTPLSPTPPPPRATPLIRRRGSHLPLLSFVGGKSFRVYI